MVSVYASGGELDFVRGGRSNEKIKTFPKLCLLLDKIHIRQLYQLSTKQTVLFITNLSNDSTQHLQTISSYCGYSQEANNKGPQLSSSLWS